MYIHISGGGCIEVTMDVVGSVSVGRSRVERGRRSSGGGCVEQGGGRRDKEVEGERDEKGVAVEGENWREIQRS